MRETTATFIGHRECFGLEEETVICEVTRLIKAGYKDFLCGGMGAFDNLCARCVWILKHQYPHIKCYLVIPYLTFTNYEAKYYDEIIYPEGFEKYYFKRAIEKRNQFLVDQSSAAICYVTHTWGGAVKTYRMAEKRGLCLVNLGEKE